MPLTIPRLAMAAYRLKKYPQRWVPMGAHAGDIDMGSNRGGVLRLPAF